MRSVVGSLKIDLAQFRDLEAFATLGSELDKASQAQLDRGYRLTELLKQGLNEPMAVEEQVIVIWAGVRGHIDDVPVEEVQRFEAALRSHFRVVHPDLLEEIREKGTLPDEERLVAALNEVKAAFTSGAAKAAGDEDEDEDEGGAA
jgi:F-type H+-transporting ATPase subunit alpha